MPQSSRPELPLPVPFLKEPARLPWPFDWPLPTKLLQRGTSISRVLRRNVAGLTPQQVRQALDQFARLNPGPASGTFIPIEVAGVPVLEGRFANVDERGILLLIHGGGFAFGSARSHRALGMHLAQMTGRRLWIPEYRLAPEHPFPAGLEDVRDVYEEALMFNGDVVVVGDSAGGNLAAGTVQHALATGWGKPSSLLLLSPWLDLAPGSESNRQDRHDLSVFDREDMITYMEHYLGEANPLDPAASPLRGAWSGFPPTYLEASVDEYLWPDTDQARELLRQAGVVHALRTEEKALHGWQLFPDFIPEARRSLEAMADFIRRVDAGESVA
jgi:monoterpene epsilon-lactone hydrolase